VEILEGEGQRAAAVVSVAGQVRRAGEMPYRKNMTLLQALDAAGGQNEFGGRNVLLFREGKQYTLDYNNLAHKNIVLKPGDSMQVEPKGAIMDRWKGNDERVRDLMK
jgi:protein involved in polysaccharide export with SLBB domain